jgi:hypothetical protein
VGFGKYQMIPMHDTLVTEFSATMNEKKESTNESTLCTSKTNHDKLMRGEKFE